MKLLLLALWEGLGMTAVFGLFVAGCVIYLLALGACYFALFCVKHPLVTAFAVAVLTAVLLLAFR